MLSLSLGGGSIEGESVSNKVLLIGFETEEITLDFKSQASKLYGKHFVCMCVFY